MKRKKIWKKIKKANIIKSCLKALNSFRQIAPIFFGLILLISFSLAVIPDSFYRKIFTGNNFLDVILGALFGSVAAGNAITSYIIGGELVERGVSIIAVTAFILTWVTVGLVQLPAEILMLGKKFAISRNIVSFFMAITVAILTILTLSFI